MFIPVKDENPLRVIPFQFVTVALIAASVAVFLWQASLAEPAARAAFFGYGLIPAVLFDLRGLPPELVRVPAELTVVTSMFLHGSWWHLLGNMLFLWVFGDNIEDAMGHLRFLVFYFACGVGAALAHAFAIPDSVVPTVGASGAISGVMGAYLLLHPRVKLLVLVLMRALVYLPAYAVLVVWFAFQFMSVALGGGAAGNVAWWAHIGGFVAGMVLVVPFRRRGVPLLDRGVPH